MIKTIQRIRKTAEFVQFLINSEIPDSTVETTFSSGVHRIFITLGEVRTELITNQWILIHDTGAFSVATTSQLRKEL